MTGTFPPVQRLYLQIHQPGVPVRIATFTEKTRMNMMTLSSNRMRCAALALCILAVGTTPMWSQAPQDAPPPPAQQDGSGWHGRPSPEQMQAHQLEHLQKHLNLTADQIAQIKTIFADSDTQMKALHENTSIAPADKHAQMKSIHESTTAKIRAVLTDEQKPKFDAMIAREHEHMGHGGPGGPDQAPPPPSAS